MKKRAFYEFDSRHVFSVSFLKLFVPVKKSIFPSTSWLYVSISESRKSPKPRSSEIFPWLYLSALSAWGGRLFRYIFVWVFHWSWVRLGLSRWPLKVWQRRRLCEIVCFRFAIFYMPMFTAKSSARLICFVSQVLQLWLKSCKHAGIFLTGGCIHVTQ